MYVAHASEKLRGQQSVCGAIHVFIQTNPFRQQDEQYSNCLTIPFPDHSDDSRTLAGAALQRLRSIYRPGYRYKNAGVMLMNLSDAGLAVQQLEAAGRNHEGDGRPRCPQPSLRPRYARARVGRHWGAIGDESRAQDTGTPPTGRNCRGRMQNDRT
jgi:DNA polymerase V